MSLPFTEKRLCPRFAVPGATVSYGKINFLGRQSQIIESGCPVVDLSRGGVSFLVKQSVPLNTKVHIRVALQGGQEPLVLLGILRWLSQASKNGYNYCAGVQFSPYGELKKWNAPRYLEKIIDLEEQSLAEQTPQSST